MTKSEIRKAVLTAMKSIKNRENRENEGVGAVLSLVKERGYARVAVYKSTKDEFSTEKIIEGLFDEGVRTFLPAVRGEEMYFVEVTAETEFEKGAFGIFEPLGKKTEEDFDLIIVPLVAFDDENDRLGRGKGFYDRYLKRTNAEKIGLGFVEQKIEKLPSDENDVRLDGVLVF